MGVRPFTSFVGRRGLLTLVKQRLATSQVVTLTGPGGVGKTRVAYALVDQVRRNYPDGCWIVELADLAADELVSHTIIATLGLAVGQGEHEVDVITDYLAPRRALLVLDSTEHLHTDGVKNVEALRNNCEHLRILITTRRPLGLSGEDVVLVPPLTMPDPAAPATPTSLSQYEAVTLFVDRATSASSDFALTEDNAQTVAELCVALEGIPLAIELAAARARALSPRAMLDGLHDRFTLLSRGYADAPDRHQTLYSCAEWSFALCSPPEQTLWCRLSVFAKGFSPDAAREVCAGDGLEPTEINELISSLVNMSVLAPVITDDGSARFQMLDFIDDFGTDKLEERGELEQWTDRHLSWCVQLAEQFRVDWVGPHQGAMLRRMRAEHANIRVALESCAERPDHAGIGLRLAIDLDSFWVSGGLPSEARYWLCLALDAGGGSPQDRALGYALAARYAWLQHDIGDAQELLKKAEAEGAESNRIAHGVVLITTALLAMWEDDPVTAVEASRRSVEVLYDSGDLAAELGSLFALGVCLAFAGDTAGAIEAQERTLALANEHGEVYRRSFALSALGEQALAAGDLERAEDLFEQSLVSKVELDTPIGTAAMLDALARLAIRAENPERAAVLLGAAESIWEAVGMQEGRNPFASPIARAEGIATCRELLGKRAFRATFRRGCQLSLSEAVAFALDTEAEPPDSGSPELAPSPLTKRETEVADLVAEGMSNPEIAESLFISVRTAQGHVENILRKLGFSSRTMIAAWVTQRRLDAGELPADAPAAEQPPPS